MSVITKKRIYVHGMLAVAAVLAICQNYGKAAVLLRENFNSGKLDPAVWNWPCDPNVKCEVVDIGGKEYALRLWDSQAAGNGLSIANVSVVSRKIFPRGGNLRITFKAWSGAAAGQGGPAGFIAPWHSSFYELASYFTIEAALSTSHHTFDENRTIAQMKLNDNNDLWAAWAKATSRKSALMLRCTLCDRSGAVFEWYDGAQWRKAFDSCNTWDSNDPYSKRTSVRPYEISGSPLMSGLNISNSPGARVGFVILDGRLFIDDILVENDLADDKAKCLIEQINQSVSPDVNVSGKPWTNLHYNDRSKKFQFAITSDITGGKRPGAWEDTIAKINLLQPNFVITVGDIVEGYTENEYLTGRQYQEFDNSLKTLQMPFFFVPGNHDTANDAMRKAWQKRYGAEYYHFIYKDVLFLCMQTTDGTHYRIEPEQIEYFKKVLRENRNVRWTVVIMHDPMWVYDWPTGWGKIEQLLLDRPYTVFAGHFHVYAKMKRNGRDYYILATTGGTSTLKGAQADGHFDHLMWVTIDDKGPVVANIDIGGIYDGNVKNDSMPDVKEYIEIKRKFMENAAKRIGSYIKDANHRP